MRAVQRNRTFESAQTTLIAVIDYGVGNIGSVLNMLHRLEIPAVFTRDADQIRDAKRILLPGVGAFDAAMEKLESTGLIPILKTEALVHKKPFLGICLGMQLLGEFSEEGVRAGLGFIPGGCRKFSFEQPSAYRVPHMGWTEIVPEPESGLLFQGIEEPRFYFVHSYYFEPAILHHAAAYATYGIRYCCAVRRENIFGVQFHPEKSHAFGMKLFRNFAHT